MIVLKTNYIPHGHVGLKFRNGRFVALLAPGTFMTTGLNQKVKVYLAWHGQPWIDLPADKLNQLRESDILNGIAKFVELTDSQRALVWLDSRFRGILRRGLYGFWTSIVDVHIEIIDTSEIESLEKFAERANLQIFVGDGQGMADRIIELI